jgi:hypothetical protein
MKTKYYYSERDIPLVFYKEKGFRLSQPVLTVENYSKWYKLHLIKNEKVIEYYPDEKILKYLENRFETYFISNHCFNPIIVQKIAEIEKFHLCEQSLEMIIGRWELEIKDTYQE